MELAECGCRWGKAGQGRWGEVGGVGGLGSSGWRPLKEGGGSWSWWK